MTLHIGEFAQRLRISTRAVRHYEALGLLAPRAIDPRTGYRTYGLEQLVRGLQIEQLKAAGLRLREIGAVLDNPGSWESHISAQRGRTATRLEEARAELATIDSYLSARAGIGTPELIEVGAGHVVATSAPASVASLGRSIRRDMQRLGRATRAQGGRCRSFSARLPLDLGDAPFTVEVIGHLDGPIRGSSLQPAERCLAATWVGSVGSLPILYDLVLQAARDRGFVPAGVVVEHYLDLAVVGTTVVRVPLAE